MMTVLKLGYFVFSAVLFLIFSIPFFDEMRNNDSFFTNLLKVLKDKRKGSIPLALSFFNILLAASLFLFSNN